MTVAFSDLYSLPTAAQIKARVIALMQANGLRVTAWILGLPSERWIEVISRAIDAYSSGPVTAAIRGFFLDLATDPGDPGDLSPDQTPRAGFLSALGEGWYGVTRGGATYATTTLTIQNTGTTTATFKPFDLTFTLDATTTPRGDGGLPTYRNTEDGAIYAGIGGTLSLAPNATATIPVQCEQLGTYGSANNGTPGTAGAITVCVTQTFGTIEVTTANTASGQEREDRALYIARCRQAADAASPNGTADAYRYAATTAKAGTALQRYDGSGQVGVTRVYVSVDSALGEVNVYLADNDGPADAIDVRSASANILGLALGDNTDPIGVVPLGVTFGPSTSTYGGLLPSGTPIAAAASATNIAISGTAKIKAVPGIDSATLKTTVEAAIVSRLDDYFASIPIGGVDQTAGAGYVYTADIIGEIHAAYAGLYAEVLSSPGTSSTSIPAGNVPTYTGSITVTVV